MINQEGVIGLLLTNHPAEGWFHLITSERKIIGRSSSACQIPIPKGFRTVSRQHAEIWRDDRGCWLRDLDSRSGTRVNRVWIDRLNKVRLFPGDLIRLGDALEIQVVAGDPTADAEDEPTNKPLSGSTRDDLTLSLAPRLIGRQLFRKEITPAEAEILLWISRGVLSNDALGQCLHRSPHTVRTQISSILRKLGLNHRAEIIGWLKNDRADDTEASA